MKIRGNTVGTPQNPASVLIKVELTEEEKALARKKIGAAAIGEAGGGGGTGNDGFSPIAKVTHTENGATITITDKDGTTTATVTNGKDGAPGKDYVLTEADKEEIAVMVDVGASTLIVTVDGETASHTSKQIYDHLQNGGYVVLFYGGNYIQLLQAHESGAYFGYVADDLYMYYYYIDLDGSFYEGENEIPSVGTVRVMVDSAIAELPVYDGSYTDMEIYDGSYTKGVV